MLGVPLRCTCHASRLTNSRVLHTVCTAYEYLFFSLPAQLAAHCSSVQLIHVPAGTCLLTE